MRDKAKKLYESGFGSLKKIAEELQVPEATVKSWKSRDETEWLKPNKKDATIPKTVATEKEVSEKIKETFYEKVLNSDLNERQRLFCIFYIQSFNATQSMIKAGYSKKCAFVEGHRLLKNPKVKEYLDELREVQMNELMLDTHKILNRHAQIAFSDVTDYLTEDGGLKNLNEVDGSLIKKIKIKDTEWGKDISIDVEDRSKSLEFLTKFKGLDPKTEIEREKLEVEKLKFNPEEEKEIKVVNKFMGVKYGTS